MMLTGFEIHGTYASFGFEKAVDYHTIAAWTLVGLWVFAIFWHFTTGEWRHYIPTTDKILVDGAATTRPASSSTSRIPSSPRRCNKHNPLQRLTYLAVLCCSAR